MQNHKTVEIQRLRGIAESETESPEERIRAASRLLSKFGPTDRNIPFINKMIRLFSRDADYNIKESALKLKQRFAKARGLKEIAKIDIPEESTPQVSAAQIPITENTVSEVLPANLSLSFAGLLDVFDKTIGRPIWYQFDEGKCDLDASRRTALLQAVLDTLPLSVQNVHVLLRELNKPLSSGFTLGMIFKSLTRIAEDWLCENGCRVEVEARREAAPNLNFMADIVERGV